LNLFFCLLFLRKLSSETMRLNQEIERHRHITATTSRYPSEMRARSNNAVLDFNLSNELNQITKQMKHFQVAFDRQHKGTFQAVSSRRRSSLQAKVSTKPKTLTSNIIDSPVAPTELKKKNATSNRSRASKSASPIRFLPDVQKQETTRRNSNPYQTSLQQIQQIQQKNQSAISSFSSANNKQISHNLDATKMNRTLSLDQQAAHRRFSSVLATTIDENNVRLLAKRRISASLPRTGSSVINKQ